MCRDGREKGGGGGGSLANSAEADLVCTLLSGAFCRFAQARLVVNLSIGQLLKDLSTMCAVNDLQMCDET